MPSSDRNFAWAENVFRKRGSGKTTYLKALALGYAAQGMSVLFVTPTEDLAKLAARDLGVDGVQVCGYKRAIGIAFAQAFDAILLDDCDAMEAAEVKSPVTYMDEFCELHNRGTVIFGTHTTSMYR